jgi:hypothetical protein
MPKHLPRPLQTSSLGMAIAIALNPNPASANTKQTTNTRQPLPTAEEINQKIQQNYPPELLEDPSAVSPSPSPSSSVAPTIVIPQTNTTTIAGSQNNIVIPTPALIAIIVIVGGLAIFPAVHLLLSLVKKSNQSRTSFWSKFSDRFQKPRVLESDEFLHHRSFEKIAEITSKSEDLYSDKFSNVEFLSFFKIQSLVRGGVDEYANLDDITDLLGVAIEAQNSFLKIESTESRYCSGNQQELYKFANSILSEEIEAADFRRQIEQKYQEILPLLKTEEGKVALESYVLEMSKIANHKLGIKLLLLFKRHQLKDFSILRAVAATIAQLDAEDLLNLDGLLLLVMVKYDVFEKLGPIIGVADRYNQPSTYSKMLQYIGLKSRHADSQQKFHEFLNCLKQWEPQYQSLKRVREKYTQEGHRLPKEFTAPVPGAELYSKYKDSFRLLEGAKSPQKIPSSAPTEDPVAA